MKYARAIMSQLSTQPYKGTRDFYPQDQRIQNWMFEKMKRVMHRYGYQEYNGPMLEPFELYAAKTGEEIVNQQLYWMMDRGERKMAVRPEMTPTFARMVAGKFHELPKPVRWFSIPNVWRYERPQRGRLREHWQLNVDVVGGDPVLADAEILTLAYDLVKEFGGEKFVEIKVNNRRLMDHLFQKKMGLTAEQALSISKAVDARAKIGEEAYAKWLGDLGVSAESRATMERFFTSDFKTVEQEFACDGVEELKALFACLAEAQVSVVFDPSLMRGLDYYTGTVFEMFDVSPENRRAMFGGGHYDNLLSIFGNFKSAGVGLGFGDVGLRNFLEVHALMPQFESELDVFITLPKREMRKHAEDIARELRARGRSVVTSLEVSGFGAQLKMASKLGAKYAVIFGEDELALGQVVVKNLVKGSQQTVALGAVATALD